jgi:hypothetical protein
MPEYIGTIEGLAELSRKLKDLSIDERYRKGFIDGEKECLKRVIKTIDECIDKENGLLLLKERIKEW